MYKIAYQVPAEFLVSTNKKARGFIQGFCEGHIVSTATVDHSIYDSKNVTVSECPMVDVVEDTLCNGFYPSLRVNFNTTQGKSIVGVELYSDDDDTEIPENDTEILNCNNGNCLVSLDYCADVKLTATPKPGYVFDYWDDGVGSCNYANPMITNVCDDVTWTAVFRKALPTQESIGEQTFDDDRIKLYPFTLSDTSSIAIISGGSLDLVARVFDSDGNLILDENGNEFADDYHDIGSLNSNAGHAQVNFMYRKQNMPKGDYTLEVTPKNSEMLIEDEFSIVFLRRVTSAEEFLAGINALLSDGDITNDYLDIYVKALYPEIYPSVDTLIDPTNYGNSKSDGNVRREWQCKALVIFFSAEFLGKGYLLMDDNIYNNWRIFIDDDANCIADFSYVMPENEGDLIYHSQYECSFVSDIAGCDATHNYFYNPDTNQVSRNGDEELADFVKKGDIFVQRLNGYNHYGIVIDGDVSLDANAMDNGKLYWEKNDDDDVDHVRMKDRWKIVRP